MPIITLTTDYGLSDWYVGALKGVLLSIAPAATLVDVTHGVRPQDVVGGALTLEAAWDCFPPGAVHLAVVDPGVGTGRRAVAVRTDRCVLVAPDNGLLTAVLARDPMRQAVSLSNPSYHRAPVSATFHGRDIFAPCAAHIACGVPLEALGEPVDRLVSLDLPAPVARGDRLEAHVIHVDRFGNLVTDLTAATYAAWLGSRSGDVVLEVGAAALRGLRRTYADVQPGEPVAYFGSAGRLDVAVRNGSAADRLGAAVGTPVVLSPP